MGEKGNLVGAPGSSVATVSDPNQGAYYRKHPGEYVNAPVGPTYWVQADDHGFDIYQDANGDWWKLTADAAHPWELEAPLKVRDPSEWRSLSPQNDAEWRAEHPDLP